jgi:hypothetical protein
MNAHPLAVVVSCVSNPGMKTILVLGLFLVSVGASAACDLNRPEVRQMVADSLKTRTNADLSKAFWFNNFKSDTYSVFMVQFKGHDQVTNEDKIYTLTTAVSCNQLGAPMLDSSVDWSVALSDFPSQ